MTAPSLYALAMGGEFQKLPLAVRRFHALSGVHSLNGMVEIDAPAGVAARILALCLGTPRSAARGPLRFEIDASAQREIWTRHFPASSMRSRLTSSGTRIEEQLGAARLCFDLVQSGGALHMRLVRLHFLGIPCPAWLMPDITAQESGDAGRLHFRVLAAVPVFGVVASYRGYLELPQQEPR